MVLRRAPGLRHVSLSMTTNLGRTFSKHYEKMLENLSVSWSKMTLTLPESMDEIQDNEQRYEPVVVRRSLLCSDEKREGRSSSSPLDRRGTLGRASAPSTLKQQRPAQSYEKNTTVELRRVSSRPN